MLTYPEQLVDPRWQRKKSEILIRDKFTCCSCRRSDETLHVHHLAYFSHLMAWEYTDDYLITLCLKCHQLEKYRKDLYPLLSISLQVNGFLYSDLLCLSTILYNPKISKPFLKKLRKIQNG